MTETCGICGQTVPFSAAVQVPFSAAVHMLVHTHGESDVVDQYACRSC